MQAKTYPDMLLSTFTYPLPSLSLALQLRGTEAPFGWHVPASSVSALPLPMTEVEVKQLASKMPNVFFPGHAPFRSVLGPFIPKTIAQAAIHHAAGPMGAFLVCTPEYNSVAVFEESLSDYLCELMLPPSRIDKAAWRRRREPLLRAFVAGCLRRQGACTSFTHALYCCTHIHHCHMHIIATRTSLSHALYCCMHIHHCHMHIIATRTLLSHAHHLHMHISAARTYIIAACILFLHTSLLHAHQTACHSHCLTRARRQGAGKSHQCIGKCPTSFGFGCARECLPRHQSCGITSLCRGPKAASWNL